MWCLVSVDARLGVNVALNRPSYQASTYIDADLAYSASYANDGGYGTNLLNGPCIHTELETNPWWAVDLGVQLKVHSIQFTNRDSSAGAYIRSLFLSKAMS